jgi:hypothetical protein
VFYRRGDYASNANGIHWMKLNNIPFVYRDLRFKQNDALHQDAPLILQSETFYLTKEKKIPTNFSIIEHNIHIYYSN